MAALILSRNVGLSNATKPFENGPLALVLICAEKLHLSRKATFKQKTIIHAFVKARVWPVDGTIAVTQLRKLSKPASTQQVIQTPTTIPAAFKDSELQPQHWKTEISDLLSSPSRQWYSNWVQGTEEVLVGGHLQQLEFSLIQHRVADQEPSSELVGGLQLKKPALYKQLKLLEKLNSSYGCTGQDEARKQERLWKNRVAAFRKAGQPVPPLGPQPILDPEAQESGSEGRSQGSDGSDRIIVV
ncbi:hypothetical protein V491_02956 [Pseudogymnoascus sp. VKM F-3775]|nr:hypothetical protein V491_02956 [Pseudogymnoascus sp. VKM F-3775]